MPSAKYPNLFIVGAQKCGTTSLYDWLSKHEEVFTGFHKEPGTLSGSRERPVPSVMTYDDYLAAYADWTTERYALDGSTRYLAAPAAPSNIAKFANDPKIIMMFRNPVDAIRSRHHFAVSIQRQHITNFEDALADDDAAEFDDLAELQPIRESFAYAKHLRRYREVFRQESIRVILFDDLKQDASKVLTSLCDWLDIPPMETSLPKSNTARKVRFKALSKLIEHPPEIAQKGLALVLPEQSRHRLRQTLRSLNGRSATNPPLNPDTRRALESRFAPQIDELSELIDRDLSHWKGEA